MGPNEIKPPSAQETDALDFYQLFEQYKQQGHSAEESEEMAWKVISVRVDLPDEPTDCEILENS